MSSDELASLRRAFTAAHPNELPRADCPPAGRIWEGVRGDLDPTGFRELIRHLARCPVCTEAWQLAQALEQGEEGLDEEVPARRPATPWQRRLQVAGAAAAVVAFLAIGLDLERPGDRPTTRSGSPRGPLRAPESPGIELLSAGVLPRDDFLLRWRGPEGAEYYDLWVTPVNDPTIQLVREQGLAASEYSIPATSLAQLPPGTVLKVYLEAFHPTEGRLHRGTFPVEIR